MEKNWFEQAWEQREEQVYPERFGSLSRGIFTLSAELFRQTFKVEDPDPRWLHCGVLEYAPSATRSSWLYVSSGMSNDWDSTTPNPAGATGLGCELVMECPNQADWAVGHLLRLTAFQLLLGGNRFPGRSPLQDMDRIPLGAPIVTGGSALSWLLLGPPTRFERRVQLLSGYFDLIQVSAIGEQEALFARNQGSPALFEQLLSNRAWPLCDPERPEIPLPLGD